MPTAMPKCKISVLKRTVHSDLIDKYLEDEYKQGTLITGCRDWFRPVIFEVERIDENPGED